jgi:hypothetical protein
MNQELGNDSNTFLGAFIMYAIPIQEIWISIVLYGPMASGLVTTAVVSKLQSLELDTSPPPERRLDN